MQKTRLGVASGEETSLLFVLARYQCGHQSMTGLLCPKFPQMAGEGREGWSALVCTQLGVSAFLQGSALPQPPTFQELERTSLIGHSVPRTSQVPATPKGTTTSPSQTAKLTLPRPCLCGSAPAPSTDQSVPAKSKRRPINEATSRQSHPNHPKMHPADRPTWYLSYTTGRVNIDTTAGEKNSTALCSCRSDSSRGETYFGGKHIIVPLGQLMHQGALY